MSELRSMTGFAEASAAGEGRVVRAVVRSVNHRYLDLHAHLPEGYETLEPIVRRLVQARVRRGHVDVFVRIEATPPPEVRVNRKAVEMYLEAVKELQAQFGLSKEPDLGAVLRLPGAIEAAADDASRCERTQRALEQGLEEALCRLDSMRAVEGERLGEEMARGASRVAEGVAIIRGLGEGARAGYAERLRERIRELMAGAQIEPARLAQEAAQLAARSDATEEAARLESHIEQFARALGGGGEAGKKLDFLCQEMLREVNTTLAKAPALGPDGIGITQHMLAMKAEIEKLREQAQNIE